MASLWRVIRHTSLVTRVSWHVHVRPLVYLLRETYKCHQVFPCSQQYPQQLESMSTRTNTPFMQKGENKAPLRIQYTLANTPFTQNITINIRSTTGTITPWSVQRFSTVGSFKPNSFTVPRARRFTCLTEFQAEFIYHAECTKIIPTDSAPG